MFVMEISYTAGMWYDRHAEFWCEAQYMVRVDTNLINEHLSSVVNL